MYKVPRHLLGETQGAVVVVVSQFNGTPKGSYSAKTGDNDCNVNSSHYSVTESFRHCFDVPLCKEKEDTSEKDSPLELNAQTRELHMV